jgi:hypothetical protein
VAQREALQQRLYQAEVQVSHCRDGTAQESTEFLHLSCSILHLAPSLPYTHTVAEALPPHTRAAQHLLANIPSGLNDLVGQKPASVPLCAVRVPVTHRWCARN